MNNLWRGALQRLRQLLTGSRGGAPPSTFMRVSYFTPRQVVLLTARHEGAQNVWPIDWHIPLSRDPELYGISLGKGGYGSSLVRASGAFVLHFVPMTWEEKIFFCGRTSGRDVDKFAAAEFETEEATTVDAPRLAAALGFIECRVEQMVDVGDHTLFIGRVTHRENRLEGARLHHLDSGLADQATDFE